MKKALSAVLLFCLLLTLAVPALAAEQAQGQTQAGQAQPGTQAQGQVQGTGSGSSPTGFLDRLQGKLADLGSAIVPVVLVVAAIVLMFSARHGKNMLVWVVAGAFLLLGGWRLLVDLVKYILS